MILNGRDSNQNKQELKIANFEIEEFAMLSLSNRINIEQNHYTARTGPTCLQKKRKRCKRKRRPRARWRHKTYSLPGKDIHRAMKLLLLAMYMVDNVTFEIVN